MNKHNNDLRTIIALNGRFTEGRLLALGIGTHAIRAAIQSRLLIESSGVLSTIPHFRRMERARQAGLIENDPAALDKANYVRRIINGKPVLARVVNRNGGKIMVSDPENPNRNVEVDPNDVAPVSDEDAEKEQAAIKNNQPVPGQAPVTEGGEPVWSARNEHPEHAYSEWQEERHRKHGHCPEYHDWVEGKLEDAWHRPNCGFFAGAGGNRQPAPVAESGVEYIRVGDTVRHAGTGATGTVTAVGPAVAEVRFGDAESESVKLAKLVKVQAESAAVLAAGARARQIRRNKRKRCLGETASGILEGDGVKVVGNVFGAGRRAKVTTVAPSGHFYVVKFGDGTSASYHESNLTIDEGEDADSDDLLANPDDSFEESRNPIRSLADRLLSESISPELRAKLQHVRFTRKPARWDEITKARIPRHELAELRVVPASALFASSGGESTKPLADFSHPMEQYFILKRGGRLYLVDTSGYDYMRHVVEITSTGEPVPGFATSKVDPPASKPATTR